VQPPQTANDEAIGQVQFPLGQEAKIGSVVRVRIPLYMALTISGGGTRLRELVPSLYVNRSLCAILLSELVLGSGRTAKAISCWVKKLYARDKMVIKQPKHATSL